MSPTELIAELATMEGACMRFCAYCPDNLYARDVKECVETLLEEFYKLQGENVRLQNDLLDVKRAYLKATGKKYVKDPHDNDDYFK